MTKKIEDLEIEIRRLKESLKIKKKLFYKNNAYWIKEKNGKIDGPFCSRCWNKDKDVIRMQPLVDPMFNKCPECKNEAIIISKN